MALFTMTAGSKKCYAGGLTEYALTEVQRRPTRIFARERQPPLDIPLQGQTRRIELVGEYDLSQKPDLAALFGALAPHGPATIDMTQVTYIDSSFLKELVELRKRLIPHRITLLVRNANVRRLLHLVKFDLLFDIRAA